MLPGKSAILLPYIKRYFCYTEQIPPLAAAELLPSTAYGFAIAETDAPTLDAETRQRRENMRRIADIARQP